MFSRKKENVELTSFYRKEFFHLLINPKMKISYGNSILRWSSLDFIGAILETAYPKVAHVGTLTEIFP